MRKRERRRLRHARDFVEKGRLQGKAVMFCLLLLRLFLSPVEVQTQQATFPYVSFVGQTLANNSYLDLALVGSNSLLCHTDLRTCCTSQEGAHSGDWYAPDATTVPLRGDMYESHGAQRVDLLRNSSSDSSPPSGLYHQLTLFTVILICQKST